MEGPCSVQQCLNSRVKAINYFVLWEMLGRKSRETNVAWRLLQKEYDVSEPLPDNIGLYLGMLDFDRSYCQAVVTRVKRYMHTLPVTDRVISRSDANYPPLVRSVNTVAPEFLFVRGKRLELLSRPGIAIVGGRAASPSGRRQAFTLAAGLASEGFVIVSGLAKGIDRAAHEGALSAQGDTIAVLGTPLNKAYPKENRALQASIARAGLLVSQFYPGTQVQKFHFPMRNALMSALTLGTAVMEATEKSGALIQARHALKQGRKLFIPHSLMLDDRLAWPKTFLKKPNAFVFDSVTQLKSYVAADIGSSALSDIVCSGLNRS